MITTRVKGLTGMNISALRTVGVCSELGATYAVFTGTPAKALQDVEAAMMKVSGTMHRSLQAVRRKLREGEPRFVTASN